MENSLVKNESHEIRQKVEQFTIGLENYLEHLKLPSQNVLVQVDERQKVIKNLPDVVELLNEDVKQRSLYISKFVAACAVGLFDAALNFLWDETVSSLREKVSQFDLDYFYSSLITDADRRNKFKTAEDLTKLEDWELIRGCNLTGILSDIGYKHLDYIRSIRNWASAAHPNQNQLTGFQLVSWLETCIKEVIAKEPSQGAISIRKLLANLREQTLTESDVTHVKGAIEILPFDLTASLLRTIFGMYCDPNISASIKNNIKLIARCVWDSCSDEVMHETGLKYSIFAANADIQKRTSAHEFLVVVGGLSYLPQDTLILELDEKIQNLFNAHQNNFNFYNEVAHAKILSSYVPATGQIPDAVRKKYVKTLMMCKIGNGWGVSWEASPYYNQLIEKFQEADILETARLVVDSDFSSRLQFPNCAKSFIEICENLRSKTANQRTSAALEHILTADLSQLPNIGRTPDTKRLLGISR